MTTVKRTPDFRRLLVHDISAYLAEKFGISDSAAKVHAEKLVDYVDQVTAAIKPI
jgi:hypothetical protein